MGGSQGATAINSLLLQCLGPITKQMPNLQILHLTGGPDFENVANTYAHLKLQARVLPFCSQMELALGAATAAIGRAGASSLAELVAVSVPAILIPYPTAKGNHQFHNAHTFAATGAALLLEQNAATSETLTPLVLDLILNRSRREQMQRALARWHAPRAAEQIALQMLGH
jgi:UDP-N-acetylglucosamine--N-acetylmuramyl-(pentapeptide) pyrophosphoryl-undecaprenol N-acetylglucosamine transferase